MTPTSKLIRSDLKELKPYNAGLSIAEIQRRYKVSKVAKLGSNENPFGPAPEVLTGIENAASMAFLYPESDAGKLRVAVSDYYSVPADHLVFGNGSEEILSIICRTIIEPGDRVVTLYPSVPLHEDYAVMMGGYVDRVAVMSDLSIDLAGLIEAVKEPAKMVVFANPMNPVGAWLKPNELETVIRETHPDTLIVIDEAYFEYAVEGDYCTSLEFLQTEHQNWMVLRTFSKAWGLAGLRIGFAVCSNRELREALDLTRTPFNTNALAQYAATTVLSHDSHMKRHVAHINSEKNKVERALKDAKVIFASSLGNFLFIHCQCSADEMVERLLKSGTIVKPWRQEGFTNFIRVSIGNQRENNQFLSSFLS